MGFNRSNEYKTTVKYTLLGFERYLYRINASMYISVGLKAGAPCSENDALSLLVVLPKLLLMSCSNILLMTHIKFFLIIQNTVFITV